MSKEKFELPSGFEPPQGYLIQRAPNNQEWVYTERGQELSPKRVREMIELQRRKMKRVGNGGGSKTPSQEDAQTTTSDVQREECRARVHEFGELVRSTLPEKIEQFLTALDAQAQDFQSRLEEHGSLQERYRSPQFVGVVREPWRSFMMKCSDELLGHATTIAQRIGGTDSMSISHHTVLLRDCERCLTEMDDCCRRQIQLLDSGGNMLQWQSQFLLSFQRLLACIRNLNSAFNGLQSHLGKDDATRSGACAFLLALLVSAAEEHLSLPKKEFSPGRTDADSIRDIISEALKYNTSRNERMQAIARHLDDILFHVEMGLRPDVASHDETPEQFDSNQAESDIDAWMEAVGCYLKKEKDKILAFLEREPAISNRKGKDQKKKEERFQGKRVLRKLEAFINGYIAFRGGCDKRTDEIDYSLSSLTMYLQEVGESYSKDYKTTLFIPVQESGTYD